MALQTVAALNLFYAQFLPRGFETPLLFLLLYVAYLLISAGILMIALRTAGASITYALDMPRAVFTIIVRDLIAIPLIAIILVAPIVGIIIAFVIWFGILRYFFQISWVQAFLAWLTGSIIQVILIALLIIPIFLWL